MSALGVYLVLAFLDACAPLYHHQFAVHVPGGPEEAHSLAHRHGFLNHGQVWPQIPDDFLQVSCGTLLLAM